MVDLLGACAGSNGYPDKFQTISSNHSSFDGPVITALTNLNQSITNTIAAYNANVILYAGSNIAVSVDPSLVISSLGLVTNAINSLSGNAFDECQTAFYQILNQFSTEVSNLAKAKALFVSAPNNNLLGFGSRIGSLGAPDKTGTYTDRIIGNLITADSAGDTIRATIAETVNNASYANDPKPQITLTQSQQQNIPLSTYISQNQ
jgi:hypothetical protein